MKWAEHKVASRYANSLFILSREQGVLDHVRQDMLLIANVCRSSRDLRKMLESPVINHNKKKGILEKIFQRKLHKLTFAMIALIIAKHRESIIPAIASAFHTIYNTSSRIQQATITTPISLDKKIREEIKTIVQKYSGKEAVELEERVDENLIGGFVLNINDKQIDTSLSSQLKSLRMTFTTRV